MPEITDTELAELEKDRARLNWVKSKEPEIYVGSDLEGNKYWFATHLIGDEKDVVGRGKCPRQAIDAAMEAEKGAEIHP